MILSASFSAIIMTGALRLPVMILGMIEASMTQAGHCPHPCFPVDDGPVVHAHPARAGRVVGRARGGPDPGGDLGVGPDGRSRSELGTYIPAEARL